MIVVSGAHYVLRFDKRFPVCCPVCLPVCLMGDSEPVSNILFRVSPCVAVRVYVILLLLLLLLRCDPGKPRLECHLMLPLLVLHAM